jgi:hypothetical protein
MMGSSPIKGPLPLNGHGPHDRLMAVHQEANGLIIKDWLFVELVRCLLALRGLALL